MHDVPHAHNVFNCVCFRRALSVSVRVRRDHAQKRASTLGRLKSWFSSFFPGVQIYRIGVVGFFRAARG